MSAADEGMPVRSFMDGPGITWRSGKPDFSPVDRAYMAGRSRHHKPGSLEKTIENAVKTFEMEASHKTEAKDYGSVDPEKFTLRCNGSRDYLLDEVILRGTYNCFLDESPLYDAKSETFDSAMDKFKTCFPEGFPWELLDIQSGPPDVSFTWRHWARYSGPYNEHPPTGEMLEMYGSGVAKLDDQLRIVKSEMFFDPSPLLAKLNHAKCPLSLDK